MAELRIIRRWSEVELVERLAAIEGLPVNFRAAPVEMTPENGWNTYFSEAVIAREPPGPPVPGGPFRRAETAVANYQFSDPDVVIAHFEADSRLLGRRMLLEMKALRVFRYLAGVVVGAVRSEEQGGIHTFGYRYDTLHGHIERGAEWFLLTKRGETGEIVFRIEAGWLPGQFPNWWSRLGFRWLGPYYQRRWHQEAHMRLYQIAHEGMPAAQPEVGDLGIAHAGPTVVFARTPRRKTVSEPIAHEEETIQSS
jgi:uncharacterized protein (UPF0548 family)